jgi:hypothetical protein
MLFSCSVGYRANASELLFGRFLTAGCNEVDPVSLLFGMAHLPGTVIFRISL